MLACSCDGLVWMVGRGDGDSQSVTPVEQQPRKISAINGTIAVKIGRIWIPLVTNIFKEDILAAPELLPLPATAAVTALDVNVDSEHKIEIAIEVTVKPTNLSEFHTPMMVADDRIAGIRNEDRERIAKFTG